MRVPTLFLCLTLALAPSLAPADILVLKNGDRLEGVVSPAPGDPDAVMFQNSRARTKISRLRVAEVIEEPEHQDLARLGSQYYADEKFDLALDAYERALELQPGDADLTERIETVRAALARVASRERQGELEAVEEALTEAAAAIKREEFESAEKILETRLPELDPLPRQQDRMRELRIALYRNWGFYLIDKLQPEEGALRLEKLLQLDPGDQEAYQALIRIWRDDPARTEQVIQAYLVQLKLNPDDQLTRLQLARKYAQDGQIEKAVQHFQTLYDSGDFQGTDVEENLVDYLTGLYRGAREQGEYEKALAYYDRLEALGAAQGDGERAFLEFRRDAAQIPPDDVERRVKLALRLREQDLDAEARGELDRLRRQNPNDQRVLDALQLYASDLLEQAQNAYRRSDYDAAMIYAQRLLSEYPYLPDIREEATRVQNLTSVALQKEREREGKEAEKFLAQAENYYQRALGNIQQYKSEETDSDIYGFSYKQEAIRNLETAIDFYNKAQEYSSGLGAADRKTLETNLSGARSKLKWLTESRSLPLPRIRSSRK